MYKYEAEILSVNIDTDKDLFNIDCLKSSVDQLPGKLVSSDFAGDSIGHVLSATVSPNDQYLSIIMQLEEKIKDGKLYAVVGFFNEPSKYVIREDGVREFSYIKVMSVGITADPADESLAPIQEIAEHGIS